MRLPVLLTLLALPALADDLPPPNTSPLHGTDGTVARLIEAHRLASLGQTAHDPVLLFAAARLMQGVTLREVTRQTAEPAAPPEAKPDKTKKPKKDAAVAPAPDVPAITVVPDPAQSAPLPGSLNPQALMEAARAMLPSGDLMRDVIADAEGEIPPPGPVAEVTSLTQTAGGNTTFSLPLAGQSYAEIGLLRLDPDLGQGHLTLKVTDAAGNLICQDTSASSFALCGIIPRESGAFLVTVTNDGGETAPYLLITN